MVGVASRSKGCNTCRKRKIAVGTGLSFKASNTLTLRQCGLQRPQCAQCIRSNRLCTGYQRETIFIVNEDYTVLSNRRKTNACKAEPRSGSGSALPPSRKLKGVSAWPAWKRMKPSGAMQLPSEVNSVPALRQQMYDSFIRGHVPLEQLGTVAQKTWLHEIADLPDQPAVLTAAALCVSASRLAYRRGDQALTHESLTLYTEGLWQLQKALWDPQQMYSDATLAACILLSMYELFECPAGGKSGYITHCDGCARLVQLRGPEAHREGLGHSLFLAFRVQFVLKSLDQHKSSFLTDEEWMNGPWQGSLPKTVADRLWDHLAKAPGILGTADKFDTMAPADILSTVLKVIDISWEMDADFQDLYFELESSVPGPLYWPTLATLPNPADDEVNGKVFPVAYEFFNLRMAMTLSLYWCALTMMYNGLLSLYGVLQQIPVNRSAVLESKNAHPLLLESMPDCKADCVCNGEGCMATFDLKKLPPLTAKIDPRATGRNVCQSVEYCLRPEMLDLGRTSFIAPLNIVVDTLEEYTTCQREVQWGMHVLRKVEDDIPYMRHVRCAKRNQRTISK